MELRTLRMLLHRAVSQALGARVFLLLPCICCFQEMEVPLEKWIHPGNSELSFSTSAARSDTLCSSPFLSLASAGPPALFFSEDMFISTHGFLGSLATNNFTEFASTGPLPGAGRNPYWADCSYRAILSQQGLNMSPRLVTQFLHWNNPPAYAATSWHHTRTEPSFLVSSLTCQYGQAIPSGWWNTQQELCWSPLSLTLQTEKEVDAYLLHARNRCRPVIPESTEAKTEESQIQGQSGL